MWSCIFSGKEQKKSSVQKWKVESEKKFESEKNHVWLRLERQWSPCLKRDGDVWDPIMEEMYILEATGPPTAGNAAGVLSLSGPSVGQPGTSNQPLTLDNSPGDILQQALQEVDQEISAGMQDLSVFHHV